MSNPRVFVGSSSEALSIAQAIQMLLAPVAKIRLWNQGIFGLGRNVLESLIEAVDNSDFAIFILRGDDSVTSRGTSSLATRDNVLFELGLFMGRLGRSRTFMVYDSHHPPRILSDLVGITFATFDGSDPDLLSALGPACFQIQQAIAREVRLPAPDELWYTEWHLGRKVYRETLQLNKGRDGALFGLRNYEEIGGQTQVFPVQGYNGRGFYWLEYHRTDGAGGGTLLLHDIGTGKLRGLITAGHCDSAALRCYKNQWVLKRGMNDPVEYRQEWFEKVGEVT